MVNNGVCSFTDALRIMTSNVGKALGIRKGRIVEGYDADIVIADSVEDMRIEKVYAKGQLLVDGGEALWRTHFQRDPYYDLYH
jgi:adenine deaminase